MLSEREMDALLCERHTEPIYKKLKKGRVAVAGLGGLGSHIAVELARAGVGHLHLIDFDVVEPSNLHRQQYRMSQIGRKKTEALREEIAEINPYLEVCIDTVRVTEENMQALFKEEDIVCEAFDQAEQKAMLVNGLLELKRDVKVVASSGMAGYASSNKIHTRKVAKGFYLCGDERNGIESEITLMAPRVSICAGHQANMVLRLLLNIEQE